VDSLRDVMEGERSHPESERKSAALRAELKRRAERGQAVGVATSVRADSNGRKRAIGLVKHLRATSAPD
jgi:hypothetical protein